MAATGSLPPWAREEMKKLMIERNELRAKLAEQPTRAPRGRPPIGPAFVLRLHTDLKAELVEIAEGCDMPLAALVRLALEQWIEDGWPKILLETDYLAQRELEEEA